MTLSHDDHPANVAIDGFSKLISYECVVARHGWTSLTPTPAPITSWFIPQDSENLGQQVRTKAIATAKNLPGHIRKILWHLFGRRDSLQAF